MDFGWYWLHRNATWHGSDATACTLGTDCPFKFGELIWDSGPRADPETRLNCPLESAPPASPACPRVLCRSLCAECVYSCACSRLYFSHPGPPLPPRRCDSASTRMASQDPQGGSGDPTFLSRSSHLSISDGAPAPHTQATQPRAGSPPPKPRIRARHPSLPSPPLLPPLLAFGVAALRCGRPEETQRGP